MTGFPRYSAAVFLRASGLHPCEQKGRAAAGGTVV